MAFRSLMTISLIASMYCCSLFLTSCATTEKSVAPASPHRGLSSTNGFLDAVESVVTSARREWHFTSGLVRSGLFIVSPSEGYLTSLKERLKLGNNLIVISGREFSSAHSVTRLFGVPKNVVDEGTALLCQHNNAGVVFVIDEAEKMNKNGLKKLGEIIYSGVSSNSSKQECDFSDATFILVSRFNLDVTPLEHVFPVSLLGAIQQVYRFNSEREFKRLKPLN